MTQGTGGPGGAKVVTLEGEIILEHGRFAKDVGDEAEEAADVLTGKLGKAAKDLETSFNKMSTAMMNWIKSPSQQTFGTLISSTASFASNLTRATVASQQYQAATGGASSATGIFAGMLGKLATTTGLVVAAIGAAIAGISLFAKVLSDALPYGLALIEAEVRLAVAVRAAQREMGEQVGTIAEWKKEVEDLGKQYTIFTKTELTEAVAQTVLWGRSVGFSHDQMSQLVQMAATLAVVNGKELMPTISALTQAFSGDFYRSLVTYGIAIGRSNVETQALADNINKSTTSMTREEKAAYALAAAWEKVGPLMEDASLVLEQIPSQLGAAQARLDTAASELGKVWAPVAVEWKKAFLDMKTELTKGVTTLLQSLSWEGLQAQGLKLALVLKGVPWDEAAEAGRALYAALTQVESGLKDVDAAAMGTQAALKGLSEDGVQAAMDAFDRMAKIIRDRQSGIADENIRHWSKMADIIRDYTARATSLYEQYAWNVAKLDRDLARNRARAIADAGRSLADADADYYRQKEEAAADFATKERRRAEDHERDMRRLRERYLDDLGDAIRKRDARAVIDLTRAYLRQRKERNEDYETTRQRDREDYEERQKDLERAWQERRASILEALDRQLADMEENYRLRLAEMKESLEREQKKLEEQLAEAQRKEELSHRKRLAEIDRHFEDRKREFAQWIADAGKLTDEEGRAVLNALAKYYGLGGSIDKLIDDFLARLKARGSIRILIEGITVAPPPATTPTTPSSGGGCQPPMAGCPSGMSWNSGLCRCVRIPEDVYVPPSMNEVTSAAHTTIGATQAQTDRLITHQIGGKLTVDGSALTNEQADVLGDKILLTLARAFREETHQLREARKI